MNELHLNIDGSEQGPLSENQVRRMWEAGKINRNTLFRYDGDNEWYECSFLALDSPVNENETPSVRRTSFVPSVANTGKSRAGYVLLCLFFGTLGIHDLYIGQAKHALIHFILSALSLVAVFISLLTENDSLHVILNMVAFIFLLMNTGWCFVQIFSETEDLHGNPLC